MLQRSRALAPARYRGCATLGCQAPAVQVLHLRQRRCHRVPVGAQPTQRVACQRIAWVQGQVQSRRMHRLTMCSYHIRSLHIALASTGMI